jgi:hypothetical protein
LIVLIFFVEKAIAAQHSRLKRKSKLWSEAAGGGWDNLLY